MAMPILLILSLRCESACNKDPVLGVIGIQSHRHQALTAGEHLRAWVRGEQDDGLIKPFRSTVFETRGLHEIMRQGGMP